MREKERVKQTKSLGIIIIAKLIWDNHITYLKFFGLLRQIKNKIPVTLLRNIDYMLINPHFVCLFVCLSVCLYIHRQYTEKIKL